MVIERLQNNDAKNDYVGWYLVATCIVNRYVLSNDYIFLFFPQKFCRDRKLECNK